MLSVRWLAEGPRFAISAVTCDANHPHWDEPEQRTQFGVVLVRRGRFRRRVRGTVVDADVSVGYLTEPGDEEQFAHPIGGDVCSHIAVAESVWHQLTPEHRPMRQTLAVDPKLALAHRRLAVAAEQDDGYVLAERLLSLVALAIERTGQRRSAEDPRPSDRAVVSTAREVLWADPAAAPGLFELADELDVSPYRLSRAFPREIGMTVTAYRNALRIGRALERIAAGETDLGALAADLGFADHAHFTRTIRRHLGQPPSVLRELLRAA